jgi:hypothetical protein
MRTAPAWTLTSWPPIQIDVAASNPFESDAVESHALDSQVVTVSTPMPLRDAFRGVVWGGGVTFTHGLRSQI